MLAGVPAVLRAAYVVGVGGEHLVGRRLQGVGHRVQRGVLGGARRQRQVAAGHAGAPGQLGDVARLMGRSLGLVSGHVADEPRSVSRATGSPDDVRSLQGGAQPLRCLTSSVTAGRTVWRSPTTPKSTSSKIGASSSLLTATMVLEVCMPARCWMAPEMPAAM